MNDSISIVINNVWTDIVQCSNVGILKDIESLLSITIESMTKKKGDLHPKKVTRVKSYFVNNKFPTGLCSTLDAYCEDNGVDLYITDKRRTPSAKRISYSLKLPTPSKNADYSFQDDAVKNAVRFTRGLLHYPTGAGKTIIMAKVISALGRRAIVIVPSLTLLDQTYNNFCKYFGVDVVGKWGGQNDINLDAYIIVATQQTAYSTLKNNSPGFDKYVKKFDILFMDECHHVALGSPYRKVKNKEKPGHRWVPNDANSWYDVAMNIPSYYRFGVSATIDIEQNNQFVLSAVTGNIIAKISQKELVDKNVLVPFNVTMFMHDLERYGSWKDAHKNNIIRNKKRNNKIIDLAIELYNGGKRVLIIVSSLEQGFYLYENLKDICEYIQGKDNSSVRKKKLETVKLKRKILLGTVFKEGFDLPEIDCLIIADGGKSIKATIQKIGRVLRVTDNKKYAEVYDFYDDDSSMCKRHSDERLSIYKERANKEVKYVKEWR